MIWWVVGCVYHVALESHPSAAQVLLPDGSVAVTPVQLDLRWAPFREQRVVVTATGYRTVELDVVRHPLRRQWKPPPKLPVFRMTEDVSPPRIRIELVPEHGPAGTWSPSDQPSAPGPADVGQR